MTDAVSDRLAGGLFAGAHATLAGQSLDLSRADNGEALAATVTGLARAFGSREAAAEDDPFAQAHGIGGAWESGRPHGR